jgi:non-heme Fe2+,alpha-ketoglutarate-dependent halogenase
MTMALTEAQVARYETDGALHPLRVLAETEAAALLERLEAVEARRAGRLPPALNAKAHLLLPWLWELVHLPAIVDPVADLLGPDLLCFGTSFISKPGTDARHVTWHQDATHWHLSEPRGITAWIALTPSTRENGCVRVLPGTHRRVVAHRDSQDRLNMLGMREEVVEPLDIDAAVDMALAPGEMSIHHPLVIHGSEPNTSGARRTGFAIRYIAGDVGQTDGLRNSATLVRGRDHGLFDLEQPPEGAFHPDAMRRHAEVLRRGMRVIFGTGRETA